MCVHLYSCISSTCCNVKVFVNRSNNYKCSTNEYTLIWWNPQVLQFQYELGNKTKHICTEAPLMEQYARTLYDICPQIHRQGSHVRERHICLLHFICMESVNSSYELLGCEFPC